MLAGSVVSAASAQATRKAATRERPVVRRDPPAWRQSSLARAGGPTFVIDCLQNSIDTMIIRPRIRVQVHSTARCTRHKARHLVVVRCMLAGWMVVLRSGCCNTIPGPELLAVSSQHPPGCSFFRRLQNVLPAMSCSSSCSHGGGCTTP